VALRFVVGEEAADAGDNLAFLVRKRADAAARGAGVFGAEVFGRLSLGGVFESAGEQRLHGGHGDFFHLGEGDVGPGSLLAPVTGDDDFSPAASELLNAAKILGCEFACAHVASVPGVGVVRPNEIVCGIGHPKTRAAKLVLHSRIAIARYRHSHRPSSTLA
jgi:hypothetical protein